MERRTLMLAGAAAMADRATAAPATKNPRRLVARVRTADPSAHVWPDGRLCPWVSHNQECRHDFHLKDGYAFSTHDLVDWVSHGPVLHVSDLSWADDDAWVADAA